jgi:GNAT superfamily N-acetyltransferase
VNARRDISGEGAIAGRSEEEEDVHPESRSDRNTTGLTISRASSPAEVEAVHIAWAAAEGWNPGLYDADAFFVADREGWFLGKLDDRHVAAGSAVRYGDAFAFMGFYVVEPSHRGRGFGLELTHARLEHLGDRITGADGVVENLATYRRIGLELAWLNTRRMIEDPAVVAPSHVSGPLESVSTDELVAYDLAGAFPAERRAFLEAWRVMPEAVGRAVVEGGELQGWGLRRRCRVGWKVGPLFADGPEIADALLRDIVAGADGQVTIDVPGVNPDAKALADRLGLRTVFETGRVYRNGVPAIDASRQFGITSLELG